MDRRTFILGSLSALAGCTSAFPPDRQYPAEYYKPQLLFEWTWHPTAGELEVEVVAGNPLTAENTAELSIHQPSSSEAYVWASRDGDGRAAFPIESGDSLTIPIDEPDTVHVVWSGGDANSISLDRFRFANRMTTGGRTDEP